MERHLLYAVCIENKKMQFVLKHGVQRHLPYAVCIEDGGVQCV